MKFNPRDHQLTSAWRAEQPRLARIGPAGHLGKVGCSCGGWERPMPPAPSLNDSLALARRFLEVEHVTPLRQYAALAELVRVCQAFDNPDQNQRPDEQEYQLALAEAVAALYPEG